MGRPDFVLAWSNIFHTLALSLCHTTSYASTFLSQLTVPSITDAIKSFDDLFKSGLPVRAHMHQKLAKRYQTLPLFQPIINRTFHFEENPQTAHKNIAHLISKRDSYLYAARSYRLLIEIVQIAYHMEVRTTRNPPYDQLLEIGFMRAVQAGALEVKLHKDQQKQLKSRESQRGDHRKPISFRSFLPVIVVWSIGCGIAFSLFLLEYCTTYFLTRSQYFNLAVSLLGTKMVVIVSFR